MKVGQFFQPQKGCSMACGLGITVERGLASLHLFVKACCLDDRENGGHGLQGYHMGELANRGLPYVLA